MRTERLLGLWDRVADAPEAAARLRRFVLDLAVRGRLVAQDDGDEPTSVLLERIAAERARRVRTGEFREPRDAVQIARHALPFVSPGRWGWARLIDIAQPQYGFAFPSGHFNDERRGMPLIRIRDISKPDTEAYFEGPYDPAYLVRAGDYLVGMDGDFNLKRWRGRDALLNQRVMRINGWRCEVDPEFIALSLQMVLDHLHGNTSLTTVKHLSAKQVNGIEVPLPPLAEQRRIVARVGELMGLLDQLEAARASREAVRDRLAAASLACLSAPGPNPAQDAEASRARHALAALPALTARPDQVKALRRTILDLAVRGRLVDQDAADEPASLLLQQISEDAATRTPGRGGRGLSPVRLLPDDRQPYELPSNWAWVSFSSITICRDGERVPVSREDRQRRAKTYDYYGASGVIDRIDGFLFDKPLLLLGEDGANLLNRTTPIAFIARGQYWVNNHAHVIDGISEDFLRYLELFINATDLTPYITGTAQPKMNQAKMNGIPVALPPLAEQRRIVARVDALMALCDRLGAALAGSDAARARLLDGLIRDTLDPAATLLKAAE